MPQEIRRFGVLQTAKVMAIMYAFVGVLVVPIMMVAAFISGDTISFGIAMALMAPAIYAVIGFIGTVVGCAIYNWVAVGRVGLRWSWGRRDEKEVRLSGPGFRSRVTRGIIPALFVGIIMTVAFANNAHAQISAGLRYGTADGETQYDVAEVTARAKLYKPIQALALYQHAGGGWACAASPLDELRCGYDGNSFVGGVGIAILDTKRLYLDANGTAGVFRRTGIRNSPYYGEQHTTVGLGSTAELRIIGPLRAQAGFAHRWIRDRLYRATFDEYPTLTTLSAGLAAHFPY